MSIIIGEKSKYQAKQLLNKSEREFYKKLHELYSEDFYIGCQINLASVLNKKTNSLYISELFRNIDFGLFTKETFRPVVLIELNGTSHINVKSVERDEKVKQILKNSDIPLITFYRDKNNTIQYIKKCIDNLISIYYE